MSDKIFVGRISETKVAWSKRISFSQKDLDTLKQHQNEKGYVNLNLKTSKEKGKQYLEIDTWKPANPDNGEPANLSNSVDSNELPF